MDEPRRKVTRQDIKNALFKLKVNTTRQLETYMHVCAHCGLCSEACHFYLASRDPKFIPAYKADRLRRIWLNQNDWLGQAMPFLVGAHKLDAKRLEEMAEIAFEECTLCGRCSLNCPFGVDTRSMIRIMRTMVTAAHAEPEALRHLAEEAAEIEDHIEQYKESFREDVKEMEIELRKLTGDPNARIPMEEKAKMLYVSLTTPESILPAAILFNKAGESWTLSMFDASNYGMLLNDGGLGFQIAEYIVKEATRLGVEQVVLCESGHSYVTYRWIAPNWFADPWPFEITTLIEVIHTYIQDGRIGVRQMKDLGTVTYHDPCNIGRGGGLFEAPREILITAVDDFQELIPNREYNYCCGGGGGLLDNEELTERRLIAGKPKADQIRESGAQTVVTTCTGCLQQIKDLSNHYGLGVEVLSLSDVVIRALK